MIFDTGCTPPRPAICAGTRSTSMPRSCRAAFKMVRPALARRRTPGPAPAPGGRARRRPSSSSASRDPRSRLPGLPAWSNGGRLPAVSRARLVRTCSVTRAATPSPARGTTPGRSGGGPDIDHEHHRLLHGLGWGALVRRAGQGSGLRHPGGNRRLLPVLFQMWRGPLAPGSNVNVSRCIGCR
jgi:hypothetical protein